jgi:hypothetical protein
MDLSQNSDIKRLWCWFKTSVSETALPNSIQKPLHRQQSMTMAVITVRYITQRTSSSGQTATKKPTINHGQTVKSP